MRETEQWIVRELATLRDAGLERRLWPYSEVGATVRVDGRPLVNLSSNDYLGLARHSRVCAAAGEAVARFGAGATASRLVVGTLTCHEELEGRLAEFKGYPASLVFGSGYAANVGLVGALVGRGDHVIIDRLAHASLVDAAVLSRARVHRFHHNEADHARQLFRACPAGGRRLLVTESVFSMDGDLAPVAELAVVAEQEGAMMLVDEAHATGVFGPGGAGLVRQAGAGDRVNLSMGTLSKALGGFGGFVACSELMREALIHKARSFIYSTALPPAMVGAALGALTVLGENPRWGEELLVRATGFRERLRALGLDTGASQSQIIPVMVGDNARAIRLHARLLNAGILAVAIRPPTVPRGTARLRFSVSLLHSPEVLGQVADVVARLAREEGIIT